MRSQQRAGKKAGGTAISKRDAVALSGDRASNKGGLKTSPPNKVGVASASGLTGHTFNVSACVTKNVTLQGTGVACRLRF